MQSVTVFFFITTLVAATWAGGIPLKAPLDFVAYPSYTSSYSISDAVTGDKKSATETRDGGLTTGSYTVLQPDGVLRTVKYKVTPTGGFQAQVINTGSALHPKHGKAIVSVVPHFVSGPVVPIAPVAAVAPIAAAPVAVPGPAKVLV